MTLALSAGGSWIHEFEDDPDVVSYRLADAPAVNIDGSPIPNPTFQTNPKDSDFALFNVNGVIAFANGVSAFADFEALAFYDDYSSYTITIGGRIDF